MFFSAQLNILNLRRWHTSHYMCDCAHFFDNATLYYWVFRLQHTTVGCMNVVNVISSLPGPGTQLPEAYTPSSEFSAVLYVSAMLFAVVCFLVVSVLWASRSKD